MNDSRSASTSVIQKALKWGFIFGFTGHVLIQLIYLPIAPDWARLFLLPIAAVANPALSCFYVAVILLLLQNESRRAWFKPISAVGRLSLTNYLFQSLVCTTLFYSYGFGLYGKVGPAIGLALTCLIYISLALLSMWWLRNFRFGPMEWIWRSLSYWKLQPLQH
jgi:uncharacterized protein